MFLFNHLEPLEQLKHEERGRGGAVREGGCEGVYNKDLEDLSILNIQTAITQKLKRKVSVLPAAYFHLFKTGHSE